MKRSNASTGPGRASLFGSYVARFAARGETVPASGLASYALCLGHNRELRRGLDLCKRAQLADPRNPHIYWCLSQLHLLGGSRKDAIEAVERGLRAVPDNFLLLRLTQEEKVVPGTARSPRSTASMASLREPPRADGASICAD